MFPGTLYFIKYIYQIVPYLSGHWAYYHSRFIFTQPLENLVNKCEVSIFMKFSLKCFPIYYRAWSVT